MGANFEVIIVTSDFLAFHTCKRLFSCVGEIQFDKKVDILDSLFVDNSDILYADITQDVASIIQNGKIVQYHGNIHMHRIGMQQYINNTKYITELWINTEYLPDLDANMTNKKSTDFCYLLVNELLIVDQRNPLDFFAIGTEMMIDLSKPLHQMIEESHNVSLYGKRGNQDESLSIVEMACLLGIVEDK